jgi:hypothetical protein
MRRRGDLKHYLSHAIAPDIVTLRTPCWIIVGALLSPSKPHVNKLPLNHKLHSKSCNFQNNKIRGTEPPDKVFCLR